MYIPNDFFMQGEKICLLIPDPLNTNFPWCPKGKTPQELNLLSPLIQINAQNSSFHIDPAGMPGFISLSSYFSEDICKIGLVASRPTSTLRRYLKIVADSLSDTKRHISQEIILSECLDLVQRGHMTMDVIFPGNSAHFLKNGLYHFFVTVCKNKPVGTANISFMTGSYCASASGPPLLSMDTDQDPSDKYRLMAYSAAELEIVDMTYKKKCQELTKSLTLARDFKKQIKELQKQTMLENRKKLHGGI
jgi:hypothetical protein